MKIYEKVKVQMYSITRHMHDELLKITKKQSPHHSIKIEPLNLKDQFILHAFTTLFRNITNDWFN